MSPVTTPATTSVQADRYCSPCARWRPAAAFRRVRDGAPWGYHRRCEECRQGHTHAAALEARALFEAGEHILAVATALGRDSEEAAYRIAAVAGWDRVKRRRAQTGAVEGECCVRTCHDPAAEGLPRCERHERLRVQMAAWKAKRDAARAAGVRLRRVAGGLRLLPSAGDANGRPAESDTADAAEDGDVEIRCHVCLAHRWTPLVAPKPCQRCGTSGATPVGVWNESAADEAVAA